MDTKVYQLARCPGRNAPVYVAILAQVASAPGKALQSAQAVVELRQLAVSALLQLEQLKDELHRLAPQTQDVRTHRMLVHTTELINKMRHGPE